MTGPWREVTAAEVSQTTRRQVIWALTLTCGHETTRALPPGCDPVRVRCRECR